MTLLPRKHGHRAVYLYDLPVNLFVAAVVIIRNDVEMCWWRSDSSATATKSSYRRRLSALSATLPLCTSHEVMSLALTAARPCAKSMCRDVTLNRAAHIPHALLKIALLVPRFKAGTVNMSKQIYPSVLAVN